MTVREGLGFAFNVIEPADDVYVNLRDYTSVAFSVFEVDGDTSATITFSDDAAGSNTATPDVVDHYYARSADVDDGAWHRTPVSPASETFAPANDTEDQAVVHISDEMCPDGMPYVKCNADAGTVTAILHGLQEQRDPAKLASPIA